MSMSHMTPLLKIGLPLLWYLEGYATMGREVEGSKPGSRCNKKRQMHCGATDIVVNEEALKSIATIEGPAKKRGVNYEVADGTWIPNLGEKRCLL